MRHGLGHSTPRGIMKQIFTAKLIGRGPNGACTHLDLPFSVEKVWGARARIPACGTVNGLPFRSGCNILD